MAHTSNPTTQEARGLLQVPGRSDFKELMFHFLVFPLFSFSGLGTFLFLWWFLLPFPVNNTFHCIFHLKFLYSFLLFLSPPPRFVSLCMCACVCVCICVRMWLYGCMAHFMCDGQNPLWVLVLFFYFVSPEIKLRLSGLVPSWNILPSWEHTF